MPSECECACAFCSKDGRAPDPAPEPALERACALAEAARPLSRAGSPLSVVLVGNDALRFPAFDALLAIWADVAPDTFEIVTPGTSLADPLVAERLSASGLAPCLSMTLHGPDEATHDAVAGLVGAFQRLQNAVNNCRAWGLSVHLHHVLTASALASLPQTLALAASWCEHVSLVAFASEPHHHDPKQTPRAFLDAMVPAPRAVRAALEDYEELLGQTLVALAGFPACLVPVSLRARLFYGGPGRSDLPSELPPACRSCSANPAMCPGPDRGTLAVHGAEWLQPL